MKRMLKIAKEIKDEDARKILKHPEDFPQDWVDIARRRFRN